ncbi:aspartate/glutamate racemase family protein [Trinickia dinghuensis]|uniref:Aspartate/glutamate racemase family protein n=1 Tax=Trinickia dinghuensis TaxID=2291023 RepID=A0A3D8JS52_9BURK|nr:amino acid racemase [Trinickia dinghuensis]RDU95848.1 aspartate/glutamate racemase family protein [Trinickia dinghuensis]
MALIGILGGMGPLATVDFMERLIALTSSAGASRDQQHLPMLVVHLPHIPDRSEALLGNGESPLPALLHGIGMLNRNEVELIVIPCNSAHHWYDEMRAESRAPIIHIAEASVAALPAGVRRVAVLATGGTLHSGLYQRMLAARGFESVEPDAATQHHIDACITDVKAGKIGASTEHLALALDWFARQGAQVAVLGCTELPLAAQQMSAPPIPTIDSTLELARATVSYALAHGWNRPL